MNAALCVGVMTLLGAMTQSSIGFGMAIVMMMGIPSVLPFGASVALTEWTGALNSWYIAIKLHRKIRWKVLCCISIPTIIVGMACTRYSTFVASDKLMIALGALFMALAIYSLVFSEKIHLKPTLASGIAMGVISGFCNGFFGIGGPPVALYLIPALPDKEEYLATIQANFALSSTCNFIVRAASGQVPASLFPIFLLGWAVSVCGTAIGLCLFRRLKLEVLRKLVYACVGLDGLWIIIQQLVR